jgi:outer membrane receptor protein involved in Fe transport
MTIHRLLTSTALTLLLLIETWHLDRAIAQEVAGYLSGRVIDVRGDAIAGASISASAGGRLAGAVSTDAEGRYRLALPSGNYQISITAAGFREHTGSRSIGPAAEVPFDVTLEPSVRPETVTITPARAALRIDEQPSSVSILDARDVSQAAAQTIDDLLRQVPGFSLFRRSSSLVANPTTQGVSLRGVGASGASRTLVLADGLPLNDAFGGWVYWDRLPRASIEQIEVVRGGTSDLYGSDALSGVINLLSRRPSRFLITSEGSYGSRRTWDGTFFASGGWDQLKGSISGEYLDTDGYFIIAPEIRGAADEEAGSRHRALTARLDYNWGRARAGSPTNLIYLRGSLFDEDRKNGTRLQRNDTATESLSVGLQAETGDGSHWQAAVFGNQQRYHQSFTSVTADRQREMLIRLQAVPSEDAGFSLSWWRLTAGRHLLVAGADLRGVRGVSDELGYVAGRPTSTVSAGGRQRRFGFFAQDLITISSRWQLVASLRYDRWRDYSAYSIEQALATGIVRPRFFDPRSSDAFSPRLSLLYRATEDVTFRAAGYRAFRAPTLNELYRSFRVGDALTLSNEALEAERLTGGEVGADLNWSDQARTRVTGYWTETVNPITNFTVSVTPALITRQRRNLGRTRARGLEVETEFRIANDWRITAGYLIADATVREAPQDASLVGFWLPQVPRHQFTLQALYANPRYATVAMQFRAIGRQFDDDQNRLPLGSFGVIDLTASRPITRHLDLFVAVQNLLDEQYAVGRTPLETLGAPRLWRGGLRIRFE